MQLTELEYNVQVYDFNHRRMASYNIFQNSRVLRSVAMWVKATKNPRPTKNDKFILAHHKTLDDKMRFWFGDLHARVEYEFLVKDGQIVGSVWDDVDGEKTDVYRYFLLPYARTLEKMIDKVSYNSARTWLAEDRRTRR